MTILRCFWGFGRGLGALLTLEGEDDSEFVLALFAPNLNFKYAIIKYYILLL